MRRATTKVLTLDNQATTTHDHCQGKDTLCKLALFTMLMTPVDNASEVFAECNSHDCESRGPAAQFVYI